MSRRELVEALDEFGVGKDFTIRDLAELVGSDDYPGRGAFVWWIKACIVEPSGEVTRRTSRGKPYKAVTYRWTGSTRATRYTQPVPVNAECEAWLQGA